MPDSPSVLKLIKQKTAGNIRGFELDMLVCGA